jgi:hypothetical protein
MGTIGSYKKTFSELLSFPRNVVDSFLHGNKGTFTHPFVFLLAGVLAVVALNTLLVDFSFEADPALPGGDEQNEQLIEIAEWIQVSNVRASTQLLPLSILILFVPMLALGGLLFLRNEIEGFYNNLILNCYAAGVAVVSLLVMIPVWLFAGMPVSDPFVNSTLPAVLVAGVMIWIYKQYLHPSSVMEWIRMISAYATGYIFFIILNGFVAGVVGYMIFAIRRIAELSGA